MASALREDSSRVPFFLPFFLPSQIIRHAIHLHRAVPQPKIPAGKNGLIRASDLPDPGPPPPEFFRLVEFLAAQPAAVVNAVGVLMYLGRGDYEDDFNFHKRYFQLSDTFASVRLQIKHIVQKIPFADYLKKGLRRAAEMAIEVDKVLEK